ncbi:MAG: aminoacyl-tRNA hydrolase [Anaerolineae bacterium]|nr:aminoacyl-tRNA hydrolase [Anaerolineae bacterium]
MSERWLIAGLGNPGPQYENTRHNMGFKVVETLAKRHGLTFSRTEKRASVADGLIVGRRVLLAKPLTYMNESGVAVRGLIDFYKIDINKLIVAADDLDLPLGTLRLRNGGGDGGQRGVRSIIQHLGTREFARARCGIGRPPGQMDPAAYVLRPFMGDDIINAQIMVEHAADAVETWLTDGLELAKTRHNGIVV